MVESKESNPVQDYWKFTRELKAQLNAVSALERQFFGLDDLCEWSIRNNATYLNDSGERVDVVGDCLSRQQAEVYGKMCKAVHDLGAMLEEGRSCFTVNEGKGDGESE